LVRTLFGWDFFRPALWIQVFAEGLTTWSVILCGRYLYGARAGIAAGLIYAFYHIAILRSAQLMTESLAACFMFSALAAFLWHQARPSHLKAALTGLLFALGCHFRVVMAPVALIMAGYSLWNSGAGFHVSRPRILKSLLTASVVFLALMIPVTIRNSRIMGHFVLYNSANAEVFMTANNPVSRGEQTAFDALPAAWREQFAQAPANEKAAVAKRLAREFMYETHTGYFLANVLPYRCREALWRPQWMYAGQGEGAESERPFGPYLRIPLISSTVLTVMGLLGLLCRARRYPGFPLLSWAALFFPVLLLPIDPRYRYLSEAMLVIPAGGLAAKAVLNGNVRFRLRRGILILAAVSLIWTAGAVAWMGGPNLFPGMPEALVKQTPEGSRLVYEKPLGTEKEQVSLALGSIPLDPASMNPVAVSVRYRLTRPEMYKSQFRSWVDRWPVVQLMAAFFDDSGTTLSLTYIPHKPVSQYQDKGGVMWRVLSPPGTAKRMDLTLLVSNSGLVELWDMQVRGPLWFSRRETSQDTVEP
jgi:hypothetical protein